VALALEMAWVLWSVACAVRADWGWTPALPYVLCPLVLVVGVASGAALRGRAHSPGLPVALVIVASALALGVLLAGAPGKAPLGYPNANAALGVQLVALGGLALLAQPAQPALPAHPAGRGPDAKGRALLVAATVLAAVGVALNRSAAGVAVVLPVLLVVALVVRYRPSATWWRAASAALGAVACAGAGAVIVLAAGAPAFPGWAVVAFDPVREQLWQDAVALWQTRPISGSGPGSFAQATALATDPDTLAAHSSVLQVGAETGWVGVGFLALTGVAGLLWVARGRTPEAVLGAAAWAALIVHSTADHLVEFGPVVLLAGVVVGWAGASGRSEELDVPEGERPLPR